jgi:hypothetical protein
MINQSENSHNKRDCTVLQRWLNMNSQGALCLLPEHAMTREDERQGRGLHVYIP